MEGAGTSFEPTLCTIDVPEPEGTCGDELALLLDRGRTWSLTSSCAKLAADLEVEMVLGGESVGTSGAARSRGISRCVGRGGDPSSGGASAGEDERGAWEGLLESTWRLPWRDLREEVKGASKVE